MKRYDVNCLVGRWPFHRQAKFTLPDLVRAHAENGICSGFVASLESIFYNDPFEGDEDLHEALKGSSYRQILTVNPTLPGLEADIKRGIDVFQIAGVRIYPGYHGYRLDAGQLENLCGVLETFGLPLLLNLRLEDERLSHLFSPAAIDPEDIVNFVKKYSRLKIALLGIKYNEVIRLKSILTDCPNVYFDTSFLVKDYLFPIEKLTADFDSGKMLYGSLNPLNCMKSTFLAVDRAQISEKKEQIFCSNIENFFGLSRPCL
jgi:predicted TIM-barrel fold metal-dependent hydrolase